MTMIVVTHEMGFARAVAEPDGLHGRRRDRRGRHRRSTSSRARGKSARSSSWRRSSSGPLAAPWRTCACSGLRGPARSARRLRPAAGGDERAGADGTRWRRRPSFTLTRRRRRRRRGRSTRASPATARTSPRHWPGTTCPWAPSSSRSSSRIPTRPAALHPLASSRLPTRARPRWGRDGREAPAGRRTTRRTRLGGPCPPGRRDARLRLPALCASTPRRGSRTAQARDELLAAVDGRVIGEARADRALLPLAPLGERPEGVHDLPVAVRADEVHVLAVDVRVDHDRRDVAVDLDDVDVDAPRRESRFSAGACRRCVDHLRGSDLVEPLTRRATAWRDPDGARGACARGRPRTSPRSSRGRSGRWRPRRPPSEELRDPGGGLRRAVRLHGRVVDLAADLLGDRLRDHRSASRSRSPSRDPAP